VTGADLGRKKCGAGWEGQMWDRSHAGRERAKNFQIPAGAGRV